MISVPLITMIGRWWLLSAKTFRFGRRQIVGAISVGVWNVVAVGLPFEVVGYRYAGQSLLIGLIDPDAGPD